MSPGPHVEMLPKYSQDDRLRNYLKHSSIPDLVKGLHNFYPE